jgi:hypothetical protein
VPAARPTIADTRAACPGSSARDSAALPPSDHPTTTRGYLRATSGEGDCLVEGRGQGTGPPVRRAGIPVGGQHDVALEMQGRHQRIQDVCLVGSAPVPEQDDGRGDPVGRLGQRWRIDAAIAPQGPATAVVPGPCGSALGAPVGQDAGAVRVFASLPAVPPTPRVRDGRRLLGVAQHRRDPGQAFLAGRVVGRRDRSLDDDAVGHGGRGHVSWPCPRSGCSDPGKQP